MRKKVPITIVTGFLGSGKTTLVKHIVSNAQSLKFAIIESDCAEGNFDSELISQESMRYEDGQQIVEMANGSICCSVCSNPTNQLKKLLVLEKRRFDGILIESAATANPALIARALQTDVSLRRVAYLKAVLTVVDAHHVLQHLDGLRPGSAENAVIEQLAIADRILLNKTDLVSGKQLKQVIKRIRPFSDAEIITCLRAQVDLSRILNINVDLSSKRSLSDYDFGDLDNAGGSRDPSLTSVAIQLQDKPLNIQLLQCWLRDLLSNESVSIFRYKGVIDGKGCEGKLAFQGVHNLYSGTFMGFWKEDRPRFSHFVFVGRNLNKDILSRSFEACVARPLRFAIGTRVQACIDVGGVFESGVVIEHWDEGNPYRIHLDSGEDVWGPADDDDLVRADRPVRSSSGNL